MNMTPVAQAVQRQGRGEDTMLVHMTPGEVGGLQALAMQHGGSLTINPQTGLPEAGFLKNILPTVLGVALTPFMGPLAAGLTVGGIETVRTGDIGKGFMAGLGAYGGANLAGSLGAAGASTAGMQSGAQALGTTAQNIATPEAMAQALGADATGALNPELVDKFASGVQAGTSQALSTPMQTAASGLQNVFSSGPMGEGARAAALNKVGGVSGLATQAGMAGAPIIADALTPKPYEAPVPPKEESNYAGPYTPTKREVRYPTTEEERRRTSEFMYFSPSNPVPFAEGGESKADVVVSPNEAKVYQDILNVQRLAGLPALDPARFAVMPRKSYEGFVYNPIGKPEPTTSGTGETNYGFKPLMTKADVEAAEAAKKAEEEAKKELESRGILISRLNQDNDNYAKGGSVPQLEDGGFVLTKKAVDGLGRGSNKKGQKVASRGLGAIPIKGPGTGTSDSIKTSIDGKRPALVSNGEAYVPKKQVAKKGGAKAFYALMKKAEKAAEKRKRA